MSAEPTPSAIALRSRGASWLPFVVLACGVLTVSTAAILIRGLQAAQVPSISIAALRLSIASLVLTPIVLVLHRRALAALSPRALALGAASGAFLAAHFAAWIYSLEFTSVASSTALVTTNPIWIGIASWLILGEPPAKRAILGIALTVTGSLLIFMSDSQQATGTSPVLGNSLALLGSITVCGYLLIGRSLQRQIALLPYIWIVYSVAALLLVLTALVSGKPLTGFPLPVWALALALAIGPQLLGHTAINWSLRHLSATMIAVAILGEPVGSAVLAWLLLNERFAPLQLLGFVALLAGIAVAASAETQRSATAKASAQ